jgi:hypothetical protein
MDSKSPHLATPSQKKVTYDDILSSLNMQVVNGRLQIVRNPVQENIKAGNIDPTQLAEQIKQSSQTQSQIPSVETPILTPEQQRQLRQIKALNYLNAIKKQEDNKRRIQATKSTKMQFNS